ncbi:MAG: hypothetical protein ACFCUJ_08570 [Thiotrichales bacterium]
MVLTEPRDCWLPNKLFAVLYSAALAIVVLAALLGLGSSTVNAGPALLILIYGLVGGLVIFKGMSIMRCPSKVLIAATLFVPMVIFLDKMVF